jgi:hypothetical protein
VYIAKGKEKVHYTTTFTITILTVLGPLEFHFKLGRDVAGYKTAHKRYTRNYTTAARVRNNPFHFTPKLKHEMLLNSKNRLTKGDPNGPYK